MRRLSIGLKWTLRYTAAMMLVVCAIAFSYYKLVERHVRQDAYLLLELQANEIAEVFERLPVGAEPTPAMIRYIERHIESARDDLRLGIRVVDPSGATVLERGVFQTRKIPVPSDFERLARQRRPIEVDIGESFPYAVYVAPLASGYVEVAVSTRRFLRGIRDLRNRFLSTFPIILLLTGGLGWWLARGSLTPIARMTEASRRITAAQLHEQIPVSGSGDELDHLAETLNAMMERIRREVERVRAFSSNAAHQLRTPVSRMRNRLEIAVTADREPAADQALVEATLHDVERLGEAVRGMLRLADSEAGLRPEQRRAVGLGNLLAEVVEFFEPVAGEKQIALALRTAGGAKVLGDASWLNELFSNLIDNALKYTPRGGHVDVVVEPNARGVTVSVRDDGVGIPEEKLARVFERFERSSRGDEAGIGLGLAVAREIALAHGGRIEVASHPGAGSTFTVCLPAAP